MCQNHGVRAAADSLNLFPFNLGRIGIEIAVKREAGRYVVVMNNQIIILSMAIMPLPQ
jgi:hypothetical protein